MRKIIILISILLSSCFSGGYKVLTDIQLPRVYTKSNLENCITIMSKIGIENPFLMIDSNMTKQYYKKYFFSIDEKKQAFSSRKLHPLYPIVDPYFRYTWHLNTRDSSLIYELGLYADGFGVNGLSVLTSDSERIYYNFNIYEKLEKKGTELKQKHLEKFNDEILPILKQYFVKK